MSSIIINTSKNATSTTELTEAEIAKKNFNKMSATDRINTLYDMLMEHEARISALEPETEPEQPTIEADKTFKFNIQGIDGTYNFVTTGDVRALDEDVNDIEWLFGVNLISVPDGLIYMDESPIDTSKTYYISQKAFEGADGGNIYYFNENDEALGVMYSSSMVLIDNVEEIVTDEPGEDEQSAETIKTYNFTSYNDASRTTQYATGTVETTGVTKMYNDAEYTEVKVTNNTVDGFNDNKYYILSDAKLSKPAESEYHVYQLYEYDEPNNTLKKASIWVTITE